MLNARKIGCAALLSVMLLSGCIANRQVEAGAEIETNHAAIPDNQQHVAESNNAALPENPQQMIATNAVSIPDNQQQVTELGNMDRITANLEEFHAQQLKDELKRMEKIKGTWVVEELLIQPYVGAYHPEPEREILGKYLIIDDDYKVTFADYEYQFLDTEVVQPPYMNRIYRFNYDEVTVLLGSNILSFYLRIKSGIPADALFLLLQNEKGEIYIYNRESFEKTGIYSLTKVDHAKEK
ncbi:MAG: hypothetical protein LBT22_07695 [Peptococcaceae bacterium]|jgi:hypothetical protein|nr:hypothetical protein [Peptococcaceae bacterium]